MSPAQTTSNTAEPVVDETVWHWLDEARAAAEQSSCAELLDLGGIRVFDALVSPLYVTVLNALRQGPSQPQPLARQAVARLRAVAYDWKTELRRRQAAVPGAPLSETQVVLWSCDVTHTAVQLPVMRALCEHGVDCRMLTCRYKVAFDLRDRDEDVLYTVAAWPEATRGARREGVRRGKAMARAASWELPDLHSRRGGELEELVRSTIRRHLPQVTESVVNARAVLEHAQPSVIVAGNDLTIEGRVACRVAAAGGVPTAVIQHGAITGDSLQARHCADRMLLFGDIHRRQLAARGVSEERLVVCGAPHLDSRPRQMGRPDAQLQEQLGLRPGERWVLVATSGPGHRISMPHHEVVVANVARLSQALPDVPIVIKLHRKDQVEHYAQALKDCASARYWVIADGTAGYPRQIYSWLQGCSVLLTGASTTAQEAMLLNVPVITMDFNDEIHGVDFIDAGATLHVRSGEELVSGVRAMLEAGGPPAETQRRIDALLKESFHALDGRAAQRCAAAVGDLAGLEH